MAIHVKTKWHQAANKTIKDLASVLAINTWKVGVQAVDHIGDENFEFRNVQERFVVLMEILIFLIQVIDRWSYQHLNEEERNNLITAIVLQIATIIHDNQNEWIGTGDYYSQFVEKFNIRAQEYANFSFDNEEPGYQFRCYLGERVLAVMGDSQDNRWVIDQVMDIEIPAALKIMYRSFKVEFKS